jgi:glyoxylase-like metal-dependent hydrolase (beta-lactamase superfamily II)
VAHHYEGDDLIVRKIRVGAMGNNSYVLECPRTHDALLVDACFDAAKILEGARGAEIVAIVETHGHADHIGALAELEQRLGVDVMAHGGDRYPVHLDRRLCDGDVIAFGDRAVTVLHTPGHTPGSICLLAGRHLVAGDTLFPGGPGNTGNDERRFAEIMDSLHSKLFVLPDDTAVYPGHGDDTTIGNERPHLEEWRRRGW